MAELTPEKIEKACDFLRGSTDLVNLWKRRKQALNYLPELRGEKDFEKVYEIMNDLYVPRIPEVCKYCERGTNATHYGICVGLKKR